MPPREPSKCYQYVRDQYGLVYRVGDRVRITERGPDKGRVGTVRDKKTRLHYVSVELDGDVEPGEWHPNCLEQLHPEEAPRDA